MSSVRVLVGEVTVEGGGQEVEKGGEKEAKWLFVDSV